MFTYIFIIHSVQLLLMFIRVKKVIKAKREYEYAYLVNSKWRKRAKRKGMGKWPEHIYLGHIGRVYRFEPSYFCDFSDFIGGDFDKFIEKNQINEIYKKFIEYELINSGFKKNGSLYFNGNVIVDFSKLMVHCNGKEAVVKINKERGYICSLYLEELFKITNINGRVEGMELMKRLKQVGAKIGPELFYNLVKKMMI